MDELAVLSITANTSPANRDKLIRVIDEEVRKLVKAGVTEKELKDNIQGYLQKRRLVRSRDAALASILAKNLFTGRSMNYYEKLEADVAHLVTQDVNEAISETISPDRFVIATAGDFTKPTPPKPPPPKPAPLKP